MQRSDAYCTPLSVNKCSVLHCGEQPNHNVLYNKEAVLKYIDNFKDLVVICPVSTIIVMPATTRLITSKLSLKWRKFYDKSGVYFDQRLKNYSGRNTNLDAMLTYMEPYAVVRY